MKNNQGFSFVELLIASLLISVVAAGTMASFIASARITQDQNATTMTEAGGRARQTLESLRNKVSGTDTFFSKANGNWSAVDTGVSGSSYGPTSASPLSVTNQKSENEYRVFPQDCDGDGSTGDCYSVAVRQCWDGSKNC
jgi:prepilin-type N-terminal cleavage/methylation domain-containing protein